MVEEHADVIHRWLEKFGKIHGLEVNKEVEEIWVDLFRGYNRDQLEIGFHEMMCVVKSFPVPAHLMDTSPLRAMNWDRGLNKIVQGTVGINSPRTEPDWLRIAQSHLEKARTD